MTKIDYYQDLGLSKNASEEDIKKAYKSLAKKHHPDRNPNNKEEAEEKFKKISAAYSVLSDKDKRKKYDMFGPSAFENGGGGPEGMNIDPFDIFNNVMGGVGGNPFGFMNGFSGFTGMKRDVDKSAMKSPKKEVPLKLSLNDIYNGKTININYSRKNKCSTCNGLGVRDPSYLMTCDLCNGNGVVTMIRRLGPMTQHITKPCDKCNGKKKMVKPNSECNKCKGNKYEKEAMKLEVVVPPGVMNGYKIKFDYKSDWEPDYKDPGDLIFVILEEPHNFFKREGCNLIINKYISLKQALTGFSFRLKHLDNRVLEISSHNIIRIDQIMKVSGEGMPKDVNELGNGDLIIKFNILFPSHLDNKRINYLKQILPDLELTNEEKELINIKSESLDKHDMEVYSLSNSSTSNNSNNGSNNNSNNNSNNGSYDDDEGVFRPENVECIQQ